MKWILRLAVGVVVVAALPFIVLSVMGIMRPTEGFCIETVGRVGWQGVPDPPTAEEAEQSYFVSPELADPTIRVPLDDELLGFRYDEEGTNWRWPVCIRTHRAEHRLLEGIPNEQLMKLREPNLWDTARTGAVYRILTVPSFSRVPIAIRLEVPAGSDEGTLNSVWLEDDGTKPDRSKQTPAGDQAWWNAPLPRRTMQQALTAEQTKALQAAFSDLPPYQMFNLDGIRLVVESVHDGRRDVRTAFLYRPPDATGRLFCTVANQSGIPKKVLADGDVDICGEVVSPLP